MFNVYIHVPYNVMITRIRKKASMSCPTGGIKEMHLFGTVKYLTGFVNINLSGFGFVTCVRFYVLIILYIAIPNLKQSLPIHHISPFPRTLYGVYTAVSTDT